MAKSGWIKLHREITDHWLWDCEFSYAQAWVDLLLKACHKPNKLMIKGQIIELKRGQQARSEVTLSKEWKWSRGKVRRFINQCLKDGMIECEATHLTSIITICNYDSFQGVDTAGGTASETPDDTSNGQVAVHKQEVKNLISKEDLLSCQHDEAINAVIDRINEITGQKLQPSAKVHRENISARLNDGFSLEDLISIVETKSAEWMGTKQQIYLVPKTLFRPSNFDRYLAESKLASKIPTAEQLVDVYHEKMPSMPSVGVITPKRRNLVTDFCLAGKMTVEKFSAYLDYIGSRCTWVMNPKYGYGFDFLVDRNTLDRARNTTLEDKGND